MEKELWKLDTSTLRTLYEKQFHELSAALLNGAEWKDVQDKRRLLIELSKLMHKGNGSHPAEHPNRTE